MTVQSSLSHQESSIRPGEMDKKLLILAVVWILSALIGAVLAAQFLHSALPYFTLIWLIIPLIAVLRSRDPNRIGIRRISWKDFLGVTLVTLGALLVITFIFEPWSHVGRLLYNLAFSSPTPDATFQWLKRFEGAPGWIAMVVYSGLVTVFAEELFFRGWLLQWLLQRFHPIWPILVQATVFTSLVNLIVALFMPTIQAIIYLLVYSWLAVGVVNGWAATRTRSIWPGLITSTLGILLGVFSVSV